MDTRLRLGDVLVGFISAAPKIVKPLDPNVNMNDPFAIDVHLPAYCAVMENCCHIGEESILLAPLIQIPSQFLDSPYIVEDFTRINREGKHDKGFMHPEQWNELSDEKKQEALNKEPKYGLDNYFIYVGNAYLQPYFVDKKFQYKEETDPNTLYPKFVRISKPLQLRIEHYVVDFKKIYRVNCEGIHKKTIQNEILSSKRLQLSIEARNSLRLKMAHYFGDIPEEDRV